MFKNRIDIQSYTSGLYIDYKLLTHSTSVASMSTCQMKIVAFSSFVVIGVKVKCPLAHHVLLFIMHLKFELKGVCHQ